MAREVFRKRGMRLEEVAIAGSNEVLQAVQILAGRDIQVRVGARRTTPRSKDMKAR